MYFKFIVTREAMSSRMIDIFSGIQIGERTLFGQLYFAEVDGNRVVPTFISRLIFAMRSEQEAYQYIKSDPEYVARMKDLAGHRLADMIEDIREILDAVDSVAVFCEKIKNPEYNSYIELIPLMELLFPAEFEKKFNTVGVRNKIEEQLLSYMQTHQASEHGVETIMLILVNMARYLNWQDTYLNVQAAELQNNILCTRWLSSRPLHEYYSEKELASVVKLLTGQRP